MTRIARSKPRNRIFCQEQHVETQPILPKWTKSLDNLRHCIEYVYVFPQYQRDDASLIAASTFVAAHRGELTEDVEFPVPPKDGDWQGKPDAPAWQQAI